MLEFVLLVLSFGGAALANTHELFNNDEMNLKERQFNNGRKTVDYLDEHDHLYREEHYNNVNTIPGEPGVDYPILAKIPRTQFSCADKLPGFYADVDAGCQVWHYCKTDGMKESFLCPNGTIYNQLNRVCEWWFNVVCEDTVAAYRVNEDLYIIPPSTSTASPEEEVLPEEGKYRVPLPVRHEDSAYYT